MHRDKIPRRRLPTNKRPFSYRERYAADNEVASLKPMTQLTGDREIKLRKLLVFNEGELVILSLISEHGCINFPMSRISAGNLLGHLGACLAQPEE